MILRNAARSGVVPAADLRSGGVPAADLRSGGVPAADKGGTPLLLLSGQTARLKDFEVGVHDSFSFSGEKGGNGLPQFFGFHCQET